ncbi:MAG TPA: esterase-like activity of phytase family protein [Phenylobacterium sp.]
MIRAAVGPWGLLVALVLAACAPSALPLPAAPVPAGPGIVVDAQSVPLDPRDPSHMQIGAFRYAGGLVLTSKQTSRLHGMSDLKVYRDGRLIAMGDEGDLLEGRLVLGRGGIDLQGAAVGLADAKLTAIVGEDGLPLSAHGKRESDSEGIAQLANGDRLVSLEEDDRILLYPHDGGRPRRAPSPDVTFPFNLGMEALAEYPQAGPDAYVVGGEASGQTWICRLSGGCTPAGVVPKGPEFGLTAVAPLPNGRMAYLLRAFDPLRGSRIILKILDKAGTEVDRLELAQPLTVDNFEGLAAVTDVAGPIRFYLISDDNFSSSQRTLLLAFDWTPPSGR